MTLECVDVTIRFHMQLVLGPGWPDDALSHHTPHLLLGSARVCRPRDDSACPALYNRQVPVSVIDHRVPTNNTDSPGLLRQKPWGKGPVTWIFGCTPGDSYTYWNLSKLLSLDSETPSSSDGVLFYGFLIVWTPEPLLTDPLGIVSIS
jgi:hypothetical protein